VGNFATVLRRAALLGLSLAWSLPALAQVRSDWRHVGNSAVELGLADLATGPVDRIWYSGDGLRIRTGLGGTFETVDFDTWQALPADTQIPAVPSEATRTLPEPSAQVRLADRDPLRVYAFGRFVYRSDNGGRNWENVTGDKHGSLIGDGLRDLAVSPANPDEITVAGGAGVFRSLDGGRSWDGLNDALPNLPGARLWHVPPGATGPQIELAGGLVLEWLAGERRAWSVAANSDASFEGTLRQSLSETFGTTVTAVAINGTVVYAGDINGRVSVSSDNLSTWLHSTNPQRGRVNAIWVDPKDWRNAVAVFAARPGRILEPQTVLHTINGGGGWDTVTNNLPAVSVNGVTADRESNAVYVATDSGVFYGNLDLRTFGAMPRWTAITGLPAARVADVHLDAGQTQLWAELEGVGLYATSAPHRLTDPRVVSAADLLSRAAAPGTLLSVMGARVESATAGGLNIPVLHAEESKSQIQIPFNATGNSLTVSITGPQGRRELPSIPMQAVAPAILEVDGAPLLQDADRGVMLDGSNPAHSHTRIQIMALGLGSVRPEWPAGTPAPLDNTPTVVAPVTAYLDREPVEVLRAVLWPDYAGVYMVEIEVPATLQYGMAELYIQVAGQESNRVRVYIEP